MAFDAHAHLYSPDWYPAAINDYLVEEFKRRSGDKRTSDATLRRSLLRLMSDSSGESTLRLMSKVGIDQKVILILDWGVELGEAALPIEQIHEQVLSVCQKSAGRLLGFAGLDPRRAESPRILERSFDVLGAVGLKLHPTGGWRLDDPGALALVSEAVRRHRPVLVHVGKTMSILSDKNASPEAFLNLAARFPEGFFIAGHSGFELCHWFVQQPNVPGNVFFDISGWQEIVQGNQDLFNSMLSDLLRAFPGRVCFGTDSPFYTYNLPSSEIGWVKMLQSFIASSPPPLSNLAQSVLNGPNPIRRALGVAACSGWFPCLSL